MQLLKEQINASHPRKNIWLSANAGTGKTFVLVNRFLRLLLDGNEPHRIVCITYTKAAAAEMQSRIVDKIGELVLLEDGELKQKLELQFNDSFDIKKLAKIKVKLANILDFPEQLRIQTIHAFCQSILKSFPLEAGIPPFFNVIDDIASNELSNTAWNNIIIEAENNESLKAATSELLARFTLVYVKSLFGELGSIKEKIFGVIAAKGGLEDYIEFLRTQLEIENEDPFKIEEDINKAAENLIETIKLIFDNGLEKNKDIQKPLGTYLKTKNIYDLELVFFTAKGDFRAFYNKDKFKEKFPQISEMANELSVKVRAAIQKKTDLELFIVTKSVLIIFTKYCEFFENLKKAKFLLDYDDLILKTAALLDKDNPNSQWVLYKLDGGIDHILLDEAQDTNPNQWKVINALNSEFFSGSDARERTRSLFVVGDEKQSIFSFQGADVGVFSERKRNFEQVGILQTEAEFESITLNRSFRSSKAVLSLVDKVLNDENVKGAVSAEDILNHELHRDKSFGYFELNELCGNDISNSRDSSRISWKLPREYSVEEEKRNKEIAADNVVARIDEILNRSYPLAETGKRPTAGDIMILLKKRDELSEMLIKKLQQKNIPVSGIDRLKLNDNLAIKDVVAMARFALLNDDDLNLACLLKSPIFELNEEELFDICWNRKPLSVYDSLKNKAKENKRYSPIAAKLTEISELRDSGCFEFFFKAIDILGHRKELIAYFGVQINEILDEFLNAAKNFESHNSASLQKFIGWFESSDIEIKRNLNNKHGEVRIMTVHGAKGLEAPIVIIPDTTSTSRNYCNYGFNGDLFLCPLTKDFKSDKFDIIQDSEQKKEQDEYYRLLYVALTRPRDELYIFGYKARKMGSIETWHNIIIKAVLEFGEMKDGRIVYSDANYLNGKISQAAESIEKPKNKFNFAKLERTKNIEVVSPSTLYRLDDSAKVLSQNTDFNRGLAIHKLLEILPDVDKAKRNEAAEMVLKNYPDMSGDDKKTALAEAIAVIDNAEFGFIFSGRSRAELPVCGYVDDKFVNGKIDRLIENGDEIIVLDYKTNKVTEKDIPKISEKYRPQLEAYKALLSKIYSGKKIRIALLFTNMNRLVYL